MTIQGCDYSFSKPTPAQLRAAGMRFVIRYIGTPQSAKNLTRAEADALQAAGLALVSNYEAGNAGWMQGGYAAGVAAANAAHPDAVRCGMPPTRPIYFSADYNATLDQYKTQIKPCLEGAGSVLGGPGRVGVYGSVYVVTWAMQDGVADWGWQTYAWSQGQWYPNAQLQQWKNGQPLGSGTVDYDRALVGDYGQWNATQEADLTDDQAKQLKFIYDLLNDQLGDGTPVDHETKLYRLLAWGTETKGDGRPNIADLAAAVGELKTAVDALKAGVPVTFTDAQLESLKTVLALEGTALVQLAVSPSVP